MHEYSPQEEKYNIISHAIGFVLSIAALVLLVMRVTAIEGKTMHLISVIIYGMSMIVLYAASTLYHSATDPIKRNRLNIFDHAAIYCLIAGTYTPFMLITLEGNTGWTIFCISWGMAITGIIFKLFFTHRFELLSTLMYVFMGWLIVFDMGPLIENLHADGLAWLIGGGIAYTIGAALFMIERIPFNHFLFHIFVLIGSFCHFYSVYFYVLRDASQV